MTLATIDSAKRGDLLGCAAVSHFIDPVGFAQRLGVDPRTVATALFSEVLTEPDPQGTPTWVLKAATRRRVLVEAQAQVAGWMAMAPAPTTDTGTVLHAWLAGALDATRALADHEAALRRVAGWLIDCHWVTPPVDVVLRAISCNDLIKRLASSASATFVGRTEELAWLRKVTASPASCVVVEAKGGMGKSALIARLLQTRRAFRPNGCFALMIDFDDPRFTVTHIDGLVSEIARQAAVQAPELIDVEMELRAHASAALQIQDPDRGFDDSRLLSLTSYMFDRIAQLGRPALLLLDTLERAVHRAPKLVGRLIGRFREICAKYPAFTLVVAGRPPIEMPELADAERLRLGPLTEPAARELLFELGVPRQHVHRILRVPLTPLTLRLAARALEQLGADSLDDKRVDTAIKQAQIDGYLQRRILAHLSTPRLSNVAELAFVLRSITPSRLLDIIGPFVEPPLTDRAEADQLFDELAQASDLVTMPVGDERRLILREEIGLEITDLLRSDAAKAALVQRIHEQAKAVLAKATDEDDLDDLEYHTQEAQRLGLAVAGSRFDPKTRTLRELRKIIPDLYASSRYAEALEMVETSSAARGDAQTLVLGARAAKALGNQASCRVLAAQALEVANDAVDRARGHVLYAESTEDESEARQHRARARALIPAIAAPYGKLVDRAEVVVAIADDDREWAAAKLREMFVDPLHWAELRSAEPDVIRGVCALIRTRTSLLWATQLGAFTSTAEVDYTTFQAFLANAEPALEALIPVRASFSAVQRAGKLGELMGTILQKTANPLLLDAIADVLDQMRRTGKPAVVDVASRAATLEQLATTITEEIQLDDWRDMIVHLGSDDLMEKIRGADLGLVVRGTVNEIDRRGLGGTFVKALKDKGLDKTVLLARKLWSLDDGDA